MGLGKRTKSKRQPEGVLQKQILLWLNTRGFFAFAIKNGATYDARFKGYRRNTSMKGISDILGILWDGRMLAIEVKTKTGRVSKEQKMFLEKINERRGIGFVARSIDDVKKHLSQYEHGGGHCVE